MYTGKNYLNKKEMLVLTKPRQSYIILLKSNQFGVQLKFIYAHFI